MQVWRLDTRLGQELLFDLQYTTFIMADCSGRMVTTSIRARPERPHFVNIINGELRSIKWGWNCGRFPHLCQGLLILNLPFFPTIFKPNLLNITVWGKGNDRVSAQCNRIEDLLWIRWEKIFLFCFFPTENIGNPPKKVDTNAIRRDERKYLERKLSVLGTPRWTTSREP